DEEAGRTRLARSESRALRRKLVEGRRPRRDEYRYAQEVPGGTGTSEAGTALTSTFRTAGCGPACPVVWEGSSGITAAPYPDSQGYLRTRAGGADQAAGAARRHRSSSRSSPIRSHQLGNSGLGPRQRSSSACVKSGASLRSVARS